uniref:Ig-like domain-containing protein n=1 Tax=Bos indicus x Bos taurus TaxID=30522 RepID=A0A4W2EZW4_BOBOX
PTLWPYLFLFSPATVHKSVISVQPPWTTVFHGERVNLTCNGFHFYAQEKLQGYRWFSGKARPRETPGNTLEVRDSGQYRCQAPGSLPSNPVHLIFSSASLILQAPYSVFEGDELVLRCQKRGREKLAVVKYTWNRKIISGTDESFDLLIPKASLNNSGCYQCIGFLENAYVLRTSQTNIQIQELFSRPKLEVTDSQPIEGKPVNLSCGTRLPLERPDTRLHFVFLRDDGVMISNWSGSPDLQITAIWREDSGSYSCGAETLTGGIHKRSLPLQIDVQRIPVSGVLLETQPQEDEVIEGETLVLVCSVAKGTGNTTFSWHREDTRESLGQKSQRSQRAELEIPVIGESHARSYYCTADNGYGLIQSEAVNVTVRSIPGIKRGLVAGGTTGGSLSILLAVALLFYCWYQRKPGLCSLLPFANLHNLPLPQKPHSLQPWKLPHYHSPPHHPKRDLVYSEIQITQPGAEGEGMLLGRDSDDSAGKVSSKDEDAKESYQNILLIRLVSDPKTQLSAVLEDSGATI